MDHFKSFAKAIAGRTLGGTMKRAFIGIALLSVVAVPVRAQTARDYFNELRDANTFNRYADKYVCFRDDNVPSFAVVSTARDALDAMNRSGNKDGAKVLAKAGDGLFVHDYYKGVANNETALFEKVDGNYRVDFNAPMHGRMVYMINWKTGRYRMQVFALDHSKTIPASETSGKCELIHPGDKPSVAADPQ